MIRPLLSVFICTAFPLTQALIAAELPPPEIRNTLAAIDKAATDRNLEEVLAYYPSSFQNSDGLTVDKLRLGLKSLWSRYLQMSYQTSVNRWQRKGNGYVLETTTLIRGTKTKEPGDFVLDAQIIAEQTYQLNNTKWQVVSQRILQEKSMLRSGEAPPQLELRLPKTIGVGRNYSLDAIITEPLGNSFVLGATIDEAVNPNNYLQERTVDLAPLRAGGIFQIGKAPFTEGDRWISVVLVQEGGITIASQRLAVSKNVIGEQYTPLPELGVTRRKLRPQGPTSL